MAAKKGHISSNWKNRLLDGTHNHYSCYLPDSLGKVASLLLRLFYSGIKTDKEQTAVLRQIKDDAIIVYATKSKSYFEYLFYYIRYQRDKLPYPQVGFDYQVYFWQPFSRLIKICFAHLDFLFHRRTFPSPYKSGFIGQTLLKNKAGMLSLVGKKGFYRRFVKAKTDPIQYLIELQKTTQRPIYIVPQLVFFSKNPHRSIPTLTDIFFGPEDNPGKIRRLFTLFKNPGKVFVEVSEPVNLQQYLQDESIRSQPIEYQSLMLRRNLLVQLNRHRQSITGPMLKTNLELKESILTSQRFQEFMDTYSKNRNIPIHEVRKKADGYIDEIAAGYNPAYIKFFSAIVGWILRSMFDGVAVNNNALGKVKRLALKGPLVLIPCHKSHIDYLILSYLLYHNNMPVPLVAAGKNLSFWPMGPLFRSGGAFFIRRSFRGAVLYSKVFAEYIHKLLQEGYNIEQFIEGGRSRTGKLLMPKLGLLSIILNAFKNGACEDMIIVPIYIGYDRVLEEKSYLQELEGGKKEPETLKGVIKARKFLARRYGKIYIQFSDPLSMNELLDNLGTPLNQMKPKEQNALCRNLGYRIINAINQSAVVTAYGLVASAILNCDRERFSYDQIMSIVETYIRHLDTQDAKLADTLILDQVHAVEQALDAFVQRKFIEPVSKDKSIPHHERNYLVNAAKRPSLEYYKNNCIAFFIPAAFTALSILEKDAFQFSAAELHADYRFLQNFFKFEFAYDLDQSPEFKVRKSIKAFIDDAILMPHQTIPDTYNVTSSGFRKLRLFSIFLKTYFESYWIVLSFLQNNSKNSIKAKDRLKKILSNGNRMYKRHEIVLPEALSKVSFQNAVDYFASKGVKGSDDSEEIKFYAEAIQKSLKALQ
ncbi:MAG: 1-acyl-sn-glycerol-3-phosphate acyltransferase [Desulfobacterales bacterium]|jgi:glycerol-3-phosphate O-acyltransferase|nr:1-acyl-sn-glycerol-3-phosphate acyltransferase [Deltaproteobacteria bacterium]